MRRTSWVQEWVLSISLLLLGACGRTDMSPMRGVAAATPVPFSPTPVAALAEIDPRAVSAQLMPTGSLSQASEQLADVVGLPADTIRVLIRTGTCATCADANGSSQGRALAELTVAEAAPLLETGSSFWLNVPPLACLYAFDGEQVRPQGCRTQ